MLKSKLLILTILAMVLTVGVVKAQIYDSIGVDTKQVYLESGFPLYCDPYDPKIACDDSGRCIALVYENSALCQRGVKILYSPDGFTTYPSTPITALTADYSGYLNGFLDYSHLPYDVTYVESEGKWYIFNKNERYSYDPVNGLLTLSDIGTKRWGIQFVNDTSYFVIHTIHLGTTKNQWEVRDITDSSIQMSGDTSSTGGCSGTGGVEYDVQKLRGFATEKDGTLIYDVRYAYNGNDCSPQTQGTFPSGATFYESYVNDYLHYVNISQGMFRTFSSTLTGYSDPSLLYAFNTGIDEVINASSSFSSNSVYYIWDRDSNSTGDGVYLYEEPLIPIYIRPVQYVPSSIVEVEAVNVSATLTCLSTGSTTTASGSQITLYSPCTNNISLTFSASGIYPLTYTDIFNIPESCSQMLLRPSYIDNYDVTFLVQDQITLDPISGANIDIVYDSNTTDANGESIIETLPLDGVTFTRIGNGCNRVYTASGSIKDYLITTQASNYITDTRIDQLAYYSNGIILFKSEYPIQLFPSDSVVLNVHIKTSDGQEIRPINTVMSAYGSNITRVVIDNYPYPRNYVSEFPAIFQFVDNRTSFDVNLTYEYFNNTYYENVTVTKGTFGDYYFEVPESSGNLSCLTNDDCESAKCVGNIYNTLIGCNSGKCTYNTENCLSCDPQIGCYNLPTSDECNENSDCLPLSECISNGKSRTGLCGSEGVCLLKDIICQSPDFCDSNLTLPSNQTTGMCRQTFLCVLTGGNAEAFVIKVPTNNLEYALTGQPWKNIVDVTYRCNVETSGTRSCIDGYTASIAEANVGIATFPENWAYSSTATGIEFYDVAVSCSDGCNITYEYCENGCADGYCLINPTSPQASARNFFQAMQSWWITMFPTIWDQAFMWTIITLLASLGIAGGLGFVMRGGSGTGFGGQELGSVFLGSAISLFLLGSFIGAMPLFISIIFAILAGFLVWQIWK